MVRQTHFILIFSSSYKKLKYIFKVKFIPHENLNGGKRISNLHQLKNPRLKTLKNDSADPILLPMYVGDLPLVT